MYRGEDQEVALDLTLRVLGKAVSSGPNTVSNSDNDFAVIDLTQCASAEELSRVSRYAGSLLNERNFVWFDQGKARIADAKKIVLVADNDTDLAWLTPNLSRCSEIVFCCDTPASLAKAVLGDIVCAIAREAGETHCKPKPLVIDFPRDALTFKGLQLLGFLDCKLLHRLPACCGSIDVTVPNATQVNLHYMLFDSLINGILNYQKGGSVENMGRLLNGFSFHFPDVTGVGFWEPSGTGATNPRTNSINLRAKRLRRLQSGGCALETLLRIHSLVGWDMPRLERFSGHEFKFGASNVPQGDCDVDIFPRGVRSTRMINWDARIVKISSESLESLELRPFVEHRSSTIDGLCLPNLKHLKILGECWKVGNFVGFSSSNNLSSCKELDVTRDEDPRLVFSARNLRETFPQINLRCAFPTYVNDEQKSIAV